MSLERDPQNLIMRPLFYDALSGDFEPLSDPMKRKHTLGRLIIASFLKGEVIEGYDPSADWLTGIRYTPTWAPRVNVVIDGEQKGDFFHTEAILLDPTSSVFETDGFSVHDDCLSAADGYGIEVGDKSREYSLPLELGEDLNGAKQFIAQKAQIFFDAIHGVDATRS